MGIGDATVCLLAEEHLDGATSMDRTTGEDHLHGVPLLPTRRPRRPTCGYRSERPRKDRSFDRDRYHPKEPMSLWYARPTVSNP
jgi:hypothetical protein